MSPGGSDGELLLCPVCFGTGRHMLRRWNENELLCEACLGMGRVLDAMKPVAHPCEECGGRGLVEAESMLARAAAGQVEKIPCKACEQRGLLRRVADSSQIILCPVCRGVGYREVRKALETERLCPDCNGLGRLFDRKTEEAVDCPECGGRGVIGGGTPRAVQRGVPADPPPAEPSSVDLPPQAPHV